MGLKSNIIPAPIVVHPEASDATPTVTPMLMRPTPLVGNWCDVPCAWAGEKIHSPALKKSYAEFIDNGLTKPCNPPQVPTAEPTPCDALQEDDNPLLTTPSESWYPERQPTSEYINPAQAVVSHQPYHVQLAGRPKAQPLNPAQSVLSPPPALVAPIAADFPAVQRHVPHKRSRNNKHHQQQQQQQQRSTTVSRFMPPPPPSAETCATLLRNGSGFDRFYTIVMRWYSLVTVATPFHADLPQCPAAENYLYDFDGWVLEITKWWDLNVGRRAASTLPTTRRH